jgi:hypothetical protein
MEGEPSDIECTFGDEFVFAERSKSSRNSASLNKNMDVL